MRCRWTPNDLLPIRPRPTQNNATQRRSPSTRGSKGPARRCIWLADAASWTPAPARACDSATEARLCRTVPSPQSEGLVAERCARRTRLRSCRGAAEGLALDGRAVAEGRGLEKAAPARAQIFNKDRITHRLEMTGVHRAVPAARGYRTSRCHRQICAAARQRCRRTRPPKDACRDVHSENPGQSAR